MGEAVEIEYIFEKFDKSGTMSIDEQPLVSVRTF